MNRPLISAAAAAAIALGALAQINSTDTSGWLERAQLMLADGNYVGCLDQLSQAEKLPMSPQQAEIALYLRGAAAVHTDTALAAQLLQQFMAQYPASSLRHEAAMALGDCYYGTDYRSALQIYQSIDPQYLRPDRADQLRYRTAFALLKTGQYDAAADQLQRLTSSRQYGKAATFYLGYIAYIQGDYKQAIPLLQDGASSAEPGSMADYYLSQIYYYLGDYDRAMQCAKAMIAKPAGSNTEFAAEAYRIAGESAYHLDNDAMAMKYLNAYRDLCPDPMPSALYILGLAAYAEGDYHQAIQCMQPATATADAMAQSAYLYIGQALMKEGDIDGAILAFDSALNLGFDPEVQETAYYNYAVASLQGGKVPFGNSVATFEKFLKRFPNSQYAPQAQKYIVGAYLNNSNYAAALNSINAMSNPTADTYRAKQRILYMLGSQSLAGGNAAAAIDYLTQAKQLAKYDANVDRQTSLVLGEAYYRAKQYDKSAQLVDAYLRGAAANDVNRPIAHYDLGYAHFGQKKYADAISDFKQMLAHPGQISQPLQADAYARLGDCYYYTRDFGAASAAYDKSYELNPAQGDYALLQKALMEGYQRHHSQKIQLLNDLQQQFPASALIPDALLEKTESYIQLGDNDGAIQVYKELVDKYPNTAQGRQGYLQMALTMLNAGKKGQAIDAYQQVITLYPSSDEAQQAADQLKRLYANDGRLQEFMAFINSVPNAPRIDPSEADNLTFEIAEKSYITEDKTAMLAQYVEQYPDGANRAKALSYLAEGAYQSGDYQQAYAHASALAQEYPDNALALDALAMKASIEYDQGKGALALRTWQDLEQKASTPYMLNQARMGIARCAALTAQYPEVVRATSAALSSSALSSNDKCQALYLRGVAQQQLGNTADARADWEAAAADLGDYYGMAAAYALAESYYKGGNLKQAEKLAKNVVDADTPHAYWMARGFILLSDIYRDQGNDFKAQQYLKSLKDNYPGDEIEIFNMIEQRLK